MWQSIKLPHLTQMYKCLTPSSDVVTAQIRAVVLDGVFVPFEQEVELLAKRQFDMIDFLRQTVQSFNSSMLARFLLLATGTDLIFEDIIKVMLTESVHGINSLDHKYLRFNPCNRTIKLTALHALIEDFRLGIMRIITQEADSLKTN